MTRKERKQRKGSNANTAPGAVPVTPGDGTTSSGFYESKQREGKRRNEQYSMRDDRGSSSLYDEKQRLAAKGSGAVAVSSPNTRRKKRPSGPEEVGATPMPGIGNSKGAKGLGGEEDRSIQLSASVDGSTGDGGFAPGIAMNASTSSADAGIGQAPRYQHHQRASDMHLVHATTVVEEDNHGRRRQSQQLPVTYASETVDVEQQEKEQEKKQRRLIFIFAVVLFVVVGVVVGVIFGTGVVGGNDSTKPPTAAPTFSGDDEMEQFLSEMSPDGGAAMRDSSTPQGQALAWLQDPNSNPSVGKNVHTLTRYVLATLFFAVGGESSWLNTDGWLTSASVCNWYTSGASPCNEEGILTDLDLNRNELKGSLPANELAILAPHLEVLDVSFNELTGTIPTMLGLLTNVQIFFIDGNFYGGTVPSELGELVSMEKIYLNANDLEGTIPEELCDLEIKIFWADCEELDCSCCTRCCTDNTDCRNQTA